MIKSLLVGIWTVAIVTASAWFFSRDADHSELVAKQPSIEVVKLDTISVSVFPDDKVKGYIIVDLAVELDAGMMPAENVPLEIYIRNELITALQSDATIEVENLELFDLETFRTNLTEAVNTHIGKPYVQKILVSGIDYLSKQEVRDLQLRRR